MISDEMLGEVAFGIINYTYSKDDDRNQFQLPLLSCIYKELVKLFVTRVSKKEKTT